MRTNAGADQHALELRAALHELLVLLLGAEAHHALHAGAVIPAAIEENHLARRGQMGHIALKVPLRLFALGGRAQRHHAADARIERFGDALDGAALAGRVAAFKEHHHAQLLVANPFLQLDQFNLQAAQLALVVAVFFQLQSLSVRWPR